MGTSKGYIAPTRPEWSKAKRAISIYLRNRDSDSKARAVSKYADAMRTSGSIKTDGMAFGASFSSSAGNVISFARGVANHGLALTLSQFGRDDLIGKSSDMIIHELLTQFTNHGSTIEDSLAMDALSSAFENLNIVTPDDLAKVDLDLFLEELIIAFVNNDFDFRFHEKISQGRTPEDARSILDEVHGYIDGILRERLNHRNLGEIDLSKMDAERIVSEMLNDAFSACVDIYGVEE